MRKQPHHATPYGPLRTLVLWTVWSLFFACTLPDADGALQSADPETVDIDLSDPETRQVVDWRDRRITDSLMLALESPSATLRYLAAMSFAPGDSHAVKALTLRLNDRVENVRIAAAFALGQIGSAQAEEALIRAFRADDSLSQHQYFNCILLEALGKCGSANTLKQLAAVTTYLPTDTLLLLGQCRSIFRFGQRGISDPVANELMVRYTLREDIPAPVQLIAAQHLARARDFRPDSLQSATLASALVRAKDPFIRMSLCRALGRSNAESAFAMLARMAQSPNADWRVRCETVRALGSFPYDTVRWLVAPLLDDTSRHVAYTAAQYFVDYGQPQDGDYYLRLAREHADAHWRAVLALYRAANRHCRGEKREWASHSLRERYNQAKNPYERAECIAALGEYPWQYRWIYEKALSDPHPAVKTSAAKALSRICRLPDFYRVFGEYANEVRSSLYRQLRNLTATGNPGIIAETSAGFRSETLNFRSRRDTSLMNDLNNLRANLRSPRDYEALIALDSLIAYFSGQPMPTPSEPAWNRAISWSNLGALSNKSEVIIKTPRGEIVLELFPEWAPAAVANFLEQIQTGYFNGRTFHRIAPGHVAQGGCPRGDGYGALDFSLRTENGLKWYDDAGYVGMARATPRNTESVQFFITHAPTPHLDGAYTLFGKVKRGMDAVTALQPGDEIERITVK